jgi:uracil-DNA glycosylase
LQGNSLKIMTLSSAQSSPIRLQALLKEVRACTLCAAHLEAGPRPVLQVDRKARILIVGQAPGRKVHASGIPFDDASGDRLRQWLGVDRQVFYDPLKIALLPMGFCYPGTGTSGDLPPRPECAPMWREKLLAHLPNIELTLVIGQYALEWHLPEQGSKNLTQTVKDWRSFWPKVLPLPHPSPRNNIWLKSNPWFAEEVIPPLQARVREMLDSGFPAR